MGPTTGALEWLSIARSCSWMCADGALGVRGILTNCDPALRATQRSSSSPALFPCLPLSTCIGLDRAGDAKTRGVETELSGPTDTELPELRRTELTLQMLPVRFLVPLFAISIALANQDDGGTAEKLLSARPLSMAAMDGMARTLSDTIACKSTLS